MLEQFACVIGEMNVPERAIPKGNFDVLGRTQVFRLPIGVTGDACLSEDGVAPENAFWSSAERQLILCYSLVRLLDGLSRTTIANTEIGQRKSAPGSSPFPAPTR